ncbi:unnamed protein product [Mytilus coruscus]|uniref:Uncharacterized protein n=1 Tax=Mytilus coruscus TaxID=42192 RepID=A0A6J8C290_MYTCO|nr:unnamed protein product [Mytilus coruscus]
MYYHSYDNLVYAKAILKYYLKLKFPEKEDKMGNNMSKQMNEAVVDNDVVPSNTMELDTSGDDAHAAAISAINQILEDKHLDSGAFENYHNLSGQALKTDDWKFGISGYPNERNDDFVSLMQMKTFGDNNMPYPRKDTFEHRVWSKNKLIPPNYQVVFNSWNNIEDEQLHIDEVDKEEILKAVRKGNTKKIPDLEYDMDDPMTPSCNTEMHVRGSSCTRINNELEGEVKMSCAMASRNIC